MVHELKRYSSLLVGLLSLVIFVELGYFVKGGPTAFDSTVAKWFASHRSSGQVYLAQRYSALTTPLVIFGVVCLLLLFWMYWKRSWFLIDFIPLGFMFATAGVVTLSKPFFDRVRPGVGLATQIDLEPGFPSGHVAFIAVTGGCLLFLSSRKRVLTVILVMLVTALTAFDRVLLGAHWFTDVVGSMFLATGLYFLFKFIEEWLAERERVM